MPNPVVTICTMSNPRIVNELRRRMSHGAEDSGLTGILVSVLHCHHCARVSKFSVVHYLGSVHFGSPRLLDHFFPAVCSRYRGGLSFCEEPSLLLGICDSR